MVWSIVANVAVGIVVGQLIAAVAAYLWGHVHDVKAIRAAIEYVEATVTDRVWPQSITYGEDIPYVRLSRERRAE